MIQLQMAHTFYVVVQTALIAELVSGSLTVINRCEYIIRALGALAATAGHAQQYAHVGCRTQVISVIMELMNQHLAMDPTR